jgi:DNA-binding HxlR family transcriptional regulator
MVSSLALGARMLLSGMAKTDKTQSFDADYPARRLLDLIGDKWTPIVLYCLSGGVRRFNEMQRQIPDISKKMLIQVLRSLEHAGLVDRKVYPVVPPKTEYRLSAEGRRLHEPVAAMCEWATKNAKFLDAICARQKKHAIGNRSQRRITA